MLEKIIRLFNTKNPDEIIEFEPSHGSYGNITGIGLVSMAISGWRPVDPAKLDQETEVELIDSMDLPIPGIWKLCPA